METLNIDVQEIAKRSRGRPKKEPVVINDDVEPQEKKPRGRPKKNTKFDADQDVEQPTPLTFKKLKTRKPIAPPTNLNPIGRPKKNLKQLIDQIILKNITDKENWK